MAANCCCHHSHRCEQLLPLLRTAAATDCRHCKLLLLPLTAVTANCCCHCSVAVCSNRGYSSACKLPRHCCELLLLPPLPSLRTIAAITANCSCHCLLLLQTAAATDCHDSNLLPPFLRIAAATNWYYCERRLPLTAVTANCCCHCSVAVCSNRGYSSACKLPHHGCELLLPPQPSLRTIAAITANCSCH